MIDMYIRRFRGEWHEFTMFVCPRCTTKWSEVGPAVNREEWIKAVEKRVQEQIKTQNEKKLVGQSG